MTHNLMQLQHRLAASKCAGGICHGGEDIVTEEEAGVGGGRQLEGR